MNEAPHDNGAPPDTTSGGLERTIELLAAIKARRTSAKTIAPADRRQLVAFLAADGLSNAEMAQILQVSDRSIERDRRAIREANAIPKDPRMVEQMVGRLVAEAELSVQRIRRTARERDVEPGIRVDSEHRCFQIVNDLVQTLQRLGYLPIATQRVQAELTHHVSEIPTFEQLQVEVQRIKRLTVEVGRNGPPAEVAELEQVVTRAALAARVEQVGVDAAKEGSGDDDT